MSGAGSAMEWQVKLLVFPAQLYTWFKWSMAKRGLSENKNAHHIHNTIQTTAGLINFSQIETFIYSNCYCLVLTIHFALYQITKKACSDL